MLNLVVVLCGLGFLGLLAAVIGFVWARMDSRRLRYRPYLPPILIAIPVTMTFMLIVIFQRVPPGRGPALSLVGFLLLSFFLFGILHACSFLGYFAGHQGPKQIPVEASDGDETNLAAAQETGNPYQPPSS
jgi:hypothetical protein